MLRIISILSAIVLLTSILMACTPKPTPADPIPVVVTDTLPFMRGIDLSFTPEILSTNGELFKDANGNAISLLTYLKSTGINTARVRLWYNPADGRSSLSEVTAFAKQLKTAGLDFYLDFHYADSWADPGKQPTPTVWQSTPFDALKDSVYQYTKRVLEQLVAENVAPKWVQIGNETNNGFLWNIGRVGGTYDNQWTQYAALTAAGCRATREVSKSSKIMLHYAGFVGSSDYFQRLKNFEVDYDVIGLSYYPWWHGTSVASFSAQMNDLTATFKKPIVIAETSYMFTLGYNDYTNNVVGDANKVHPDYPASPAGQAAFVQKMLDLNRAVPNNMGRGVCYWAGDWVAYRGATATNGSAWENLALFDFQNRALPALQVLGKQ
jgi:arabinogalactan endo-1,4-beta-galactosidase